MSATRDLKGRFLNTVTMFLVSGVSLILLIYIGFGEAQRTYKQFNVEKLQAQGRVIQNAMETFLRPGLPMRQYVGFTTRTEPILESDDTIAAIAAFDPGGNPVFSSGDTRIPLLPASTAATGDKSVDLRENGDYFQLVLPLRDRFEVVGSLALTMPRSVITQRVQDSFQPLVYIAGGLSLAFALFVVIGGRWLFGRRTPWLQIGYAMIFLAMSGVVVVTLVSLYSEGAQAKTKALADSLGQRVSDIVAFNLNINEMTGLDRTFGDYRRLNPDISSAGLAIDGIVEIHTNPNAVGRPWTRESGTYEYVYTLTAANNPRTITIAVALPTEIVFRQVARSVKNFAALFVASAFLAGLFLQLAASMQQANNDGGDESIDGSQKRDQIALNLVKPVFFVAVFVEHLNHPFLPQFMHQAAAASGLTPNFASAPFMIYYLAFALALIPAGHYAQRHSAKPLMYCGLLLAALGLMALALPLDLYTLTAARGLSGIGQGMLFIGVQSYILATASPGRKTQGAAIIVLGFQGGMISGTAIGSLIVIYMGPEGVFMLAGFIALMMALYASALVPGTSARSYAGTDRLGGTIRQLGHDMGQVLRNLDFLRTMILVGVPAKAVMTGVIIFALPLLLSDLNFAQEDIGQVIMLYAAGVLLASTYVSRRVDRTGRTEAILFWGTVLSGAGLMLVGLVDLKPTVELPFDLPIATLVLITGVFIVGLAHGFINAPVVTHVANSELAAKIGASSATATYRFLERIGHVAGPMIVAQLFFFGGQTATVIAWIGGAIMVFGVLFILQAASAGHAATRKEMPS